MVTETIAGIPSFRIKVNGTELQVQDDERVAEVSVEQSLHLPDMFVIRFHDISSAGDPGAVATYEIFEADTLPMGAEVNIEMGYGTSLTQVTKGEVTALEVDAAPDGTPILTVRGYARSHRLHRGRKSRSFLNIKDSDIASQLAREAGMSVTVDATSHVYPYLFQNNQSNWEFLKERAIRIGYDLYANGSALFFQKPQAGGRTGPDQTLGQNLVSFRVKISAAHQVEEVEVRGWDMEQKQAIVGTATTPQGEPATSLAKNGKQVAQLFGTAKFSVVNRVVADSAEAETLAKAAFDSLDGSYVQAEGVSLGDAGIKPGVTIALGDVGAKVSGTYYVTGATHRVSGPEGYLTTFQVTGRQSDSLLELVGLRRESASLPSVVVGVVTDNTDADKGLGRVKVKFPWLADNEQSWWARVASPMAGPERGFYFLPEVDDEVLVAFEHGDITRPYVLGSLWNGQDKPPKANSAVVANSKVNERMIKTRSGHIISLDDTENAEKISITDKTGKNLITIDSSTNKITIQADADVAIVAKGNATVSAEQDSTVEVKGNATVKASQNVTVTASGNAEVKASGNASVSATGTLELKGATVNIEAQGTMSVKANGPLTLKGAVVNIN